MTVNAPPPFRRIVTGHNAAGEAVIVSDAPPVRVQRIGADGPTLHEVWHTTETPALLDAAGLEPTEARLTLAPPRHGTRIRVLDIPPETPATAQLDPAAARAHFAAIGAADASTHGAHPMMHRTQSIDYGIVLDGELTLIVDHGETVVRTGDIVVQRGTNHAWSNRSGRNCRIAFILIDGVFAPELARNDAGHD